MFFKLWDFDVKNPKPDSFMFALLCLVLYVGHSGLSSDELLEKLKKIDAVYDWDFAKRRFERGTILTGYSTTDEHVEEATQLNKERATVLRGLLVGERDGAKWDVWTRFHDALNSMQSELGDRFFFRANKAIFLEDVNQHGARLMMDKLQTPDQPAPQPRALDLSSTNRTAAPTGHPAPAKGAKRRLSFSGKNSISL